MSKRENVQRYRDRKERERATGAWKFGSVSV